MSVYEFDELEHAPLIIDAIYKSKSTLFGDGPIGKLLPKVGNQGGFRVVKRQDNSNQLAYIVLYTTGTEIDWPDSLDLETGIWRYFGDNRTPGKSLHDTPAKGNHYLREIFSKIDSPTERANIPPFLIFQWAGNLFDAKFLGIAVPGNPNIPPDRELNAIWRSTKGNRFQNYEAYFSVLDTGREEVSKEWLRKLITDHANSLSLAPATWKQFIEFGRPGVKPLLSPRSTEVPSKEQQLPQLANDKKLLQKIRDHYKDNPFGFELCSTKLVQMMDNNFEQFELTRPWRDGGRDAIGRYKIGNNHNPLLVEFALEAKCYSAEVSVGVKPMSRLISRLRYRQFGVLVTTSYVHSQAYNEILDDGHPILVINARDIAKILRDQGINYQNVDTWLNQIDQESIPA
jgi:hypothetical protein